MSGNMERVLRLMADKNASDVYISANTAILIKIHGQIMQLSDQLVSPSAYSTKSLRIGYIGTANDARLGWGPAPDTAACGCWGRKLAGSEKTEGKLRGT